MLGTAVVSEAAEKAHMAETWYYDTRGRITLNLKGGVQNLWKGIDFFGFIDVESSKNEENPATPYSEIRFSRELGKGWSIATEYNRNLNRSEGATRFGFIYTPNLGIDGLIVSARLYPVADNSGAQAVLFAKKSFARSYLESVLDINEGGKVFSETQFGREISPGTHWVTEIRYNDFREDDFGIATGLEFKLK